MLETNYDERAFKVLSAIEDYLEREPETTCDGREAFLEALSVNLQSDEETKRWAEHMAICPRCREACAMLHRAGVYEDMPFYDRVRKYEENPKAETDENWKKIAFIFRPELKFVPDAESGKLPIGGPAASVYGGAEAGAKEGLLGTCACAGARGGRVEAMRYYQMAAKVEPTLACYEMPSKTCASLDWESVAEGLKRKRNAAWRRLSYSAALCLCVAAGVVGFWGQNPELPVAPPVAPESRGFGGSSKGLSGQLGILSFDFGGVNEIYEEGAASFGDGDYSTAAEKFALLVERLQGDDVIVYLSGHGLADDEVARQALSVARWNLAVAAICSGEVSTGVRVLEEIKAMKLDDAEMNARVDAAIETYSTSETTW